jgi:hypothetical protein
MVTLTAIVLGVPGGLALAQGTTTQQPNATQAASEQAPVVTADQAWRDLPPEQLAAFERYCPTVPCLTVDAGNVTEALGEHTTAEALLKYGREPKSCPDALAEYQARGVKVGAFLGRCPSRDEATQLAQTALEAGPDTAIDGSESTNAGGTP